MKIFALNLCLHVTYKHLLHDPQLTLISFEELMNALFKGEIPESGTFLVKATTGDDFLDNVFEMQKNEVWRDQDITIQLVLESEKMYEAFVQAFRDKFSNVDTAGGVVVNEKGEYLMIFHRNRWSLPKGQVEWLEDPQQAAVREVQEETGLHTLEVRENVGKTYHTFKKGKKWIFKTTHWFTMHASSEEALIPQSEEHITDIRWVNKDSWPEIKPAAFPQIRYVLREAF